MNKLVYIILVNYNSIEDTIDCIKSIKRQDYKNIKTVVVNNDSNKDFEEKIKNEFLDIIVIQEKENVGFAIANNHGIKIALEDNADFVMLLNNDTIIKQNYISMLLGSYENNKENNIGIITGKILFYEPNTLIWHAGGKINKIKGTVDIVGYKEEDYGQYNNITYNDFASGCCMLIPAKVIRDVGVMSDEYFLYYEDVDYCNKVKAKGYKIFSENNAEMFHKESASTKKGSNVYSYYYIRNRFYYIKNNSKGLNKYMAYIYSFLWTIKKIITKEVNYKYAVEGYKDFKNSKMGKKIF